MPESPILHPREQSDIAPFARQVSRTPARRPTPRAVGHGDMITNPSLVVEVLSPSTEAWDRGGKFVQYRTVASLEEYVLVSPDALRVEWITRAANGSWAYREATGLGAVRRLARLGVDLPLAHIYRTVDGLNAESPRSA